MNQAVRTHLEMLIAAVNRQHAISFTGHHNPFLLWASIFASTVDDECLLVEFLCLPFIFISIISFFSILGLYIPELKMRTESLKRN